jgi:hypothetical protein
MSTQPSEHATHELREALKVMMRHVENYVPDIPAGGYIDHDLKLAATVLAKYEEKSRPPHITSPASDMREALARIHGLTMSQVRDAAEGFQLCREIAARALSENEEKK